MRKFFLTFLSVCMMGVVVANAQVAHDAEYKDSIEAKILSTIPANMEVGAIRVLKASVNEKKQVVNVDMNETYSYVPFTETTLNEVKSHVLSVLPMKYKAYSVNLTIKGVDINKYIPVYSKKYRKKNEPFITAQDPNDNYSQGLNGNIIA